MPSSFLDSASVAHRNRRQRPRPRGVTLIELLVVISIVSILAAMILPAVQSVRESARRVQCANHLKQIGLAMISHEATHRRLPTGGWGYRWVVEPDRGFGKDQPGGWVYFLLPNLEHGNIVSDVQTATGTDRDAALARMLSTPVAVFHCPSRRSAERYPTQWQAFNAGRAELVAKTDYAANAGELFFDAGSGPVSLQQGDSPLYEWPDHKGNGICYLRSELALASVLDGTSNTYMVGEKNLPVEFYRTGSHRGDDQSMYSGDDFDTLRWGGTLLTPVQDREVKNAERRFGSAHPAVCHFLMCDGSVQGKTFSIDGELHAKLSNRCDGGSITLDVN